MRATLIAKTEFFHPGEDCGDWQTDVDGGEALIEFAGRECYQSWSKPNPEGRTNFGYVTGSILSHAHFSVIEHATCTYRITGIPRSLTHELIRHRLFSYSEVSQRYVPVDNTPLIDHPLLRDLPANLVEYAKDIMQDTAINTREAYRGLEAVLREAGFKGKKVRQAARGVAPESTETRIVVTGNLRAWRHFINMRAAVHADDAIRELAIDILRDLQTHYPAVFSDYTIRTLATGETVAEGKYHDIS